MNVEDLIRHFELIPLPEEGGFYREVYRSEQVFSQDPLNQLPENARHHATSIYYLITPEEFSALHRIHQDELFHFYLGDPVEMLQISPDGKLAHYTLSNQLKTGTHPFKAVPANHWQGLRLHPGGKWALLGCSVAPGFDFKDFQLGDRTALQKQFPEHQNLIQEWAREA